MNDTFFNEIEVTVGDMDFENSSLTELTVFDPTGMEHTAYTLGDPTILDCEYQCAPDNCAVEAERAIINMFTETPLTQQDAIYISSTNGWYQPGVGTSPTNIGNMMEMFNIPNHSVMDASVTDLARELAQGHGVIVGVDSNEMWDQGPLADLKSWMSTNLGIDFGDTAANHAVVVTGIDVTDPGNPMVIINDSGIPDGQGSAYPLEKFMHCWEDSGFYYTATDIPLPQERLHGSLSDMNEALGNMHFGSANGDFVGAVTGGFAGGFAGGFTAMETYHQTGSVLDAIVTGIEVGTDVAQTSSSLVDSYFANDSAIIDL